MIIIKIILKTGGESVTSPEPCKWGVNDGRTKFLLIKTNKRDIKFGVLYKKKRRSVLNLNRCINGKKTEKKVEVERYTQVKRGRSSYNKSQRKS